MLPPRRSSGVGSAAEGNAQLAQDVRAKGAGTARIAMKSFGSAASLLGRIATHDVGTIERLGAGPSGSEDEILDQLRALGYIE